MTSPEFINVSYIKTTPERLWQALTDPAFTKLYWGATFDTDWDAGSPMTWHQFGVAIAIPEQLVLESEPCTRLSYAWHDFTPELAEAVGFPDDFQARVATEPRSKVTFEIEPLDDEQVKLTVVHDGLDPDALMRLMISQGWPRVLSNLKTLLETGEPLPHSSVVRKPVKAQAAAS